VSAASGIGAALRFGVRLAGARGEQSVRLAARAIRGVALGVVVTALIQASIGGVGLALAEVPFAPLLSAVLFILCIAQIGPGPILVPAIIWMFATDRISSGVILAVATVLALGVDNIIRPVSIRREANLPILLILAGVIGGLLGVGLIGLFLGRLSSQ
jgi:predicted PurR-regulated permease PerM